jgi:acyl carrier protein
MTAMQTAEVIREFVVDNFLFGDDENLKEGDSFLENGIVDSTGILELVEFIEKTYHIQVEDDELIPENLDSIANVVKYLEHKRNGNQ